MPHRFRLLTAFALAAVAAFTAFSGCAQEDDTPAEVVDAPVESVEPVVPATESTPQAAGGEGAPVESSAPVVTEEPVVESSTPATDPPATDPPATDPPVTDPPATLPPLTEPPATEPPATPAPAVYFANCDEARAAGAAPLRRGDPGYRSGLDRDGDGSACES